jgi:eukaryotic-like serine/threonine-protein kinase
MRPEQAERIAEIVEQALEVEGTRRGAVVADLCGGDADLLGEVGSLLVFQEKARDFIEQPAVEKVAEMLADECRELKPGEVLGDYKILSLIGEGGMGEVYLAEDTKLHRKVAVKFLKYGFGASNFVRHFYREERILAGLTHPNIAQLYGGAVTEAGLPYFVMEYVAGPRLDDYCRDNQLSIPQRLDLFRKICAAVSYAHQHLVIHRDIKPANIRVTHGGEPKLLDFGIARLLDPETAAIADQTVTLANVMTPEYASPEQVRGEKMTTASDVYSLGVVLYELLTGQKPYKIGNRTPAAVARAISDQEPAKPSTVVASASGHWFPGWKSVPHLRGDLDNIVLKALRKEPERRYRSVGQFAEDIRHYLEGRPVTARKDTAGYRASKFVARNKVAVAAASLILFTIVAGSIAALWQGQIARRQRDVAERERLKAQRINTFLQDMLGAAAPETKGVDVKVIEVLSEASRRAKSELTNQPDVMADVLMTLGRTYISLGLFAPAEKNLRAALDASRQANGELNETTATTMGWLGLDLAFQDKAAEGETMSRQAVVLQRKLHPHGNAELGVALYSLGMNLVWQGNGKAAEPFLEEAVDLIGKYLGKNHGYYMATLSGLGLAREQSGNMAGAEQLFRRAIEVGNHVNDRYRIFRAQARSYLGELLTNRGAYAEAETVLRESYATYRKVLGDDSSSVATIRRDLGRVYFLKGDYSSAEAQYRKALDLSLKFFPREHPIVVGVKAALGLTLTRLGRAAKGEPLLREALTIRKKLLPSENVLIPFTESALGECLTAEKRYAEAEPLLIHGYNGLKSKLDGGDRRAIEARQRLVKLYEAWGKPNQAARYR